MRVPGEDAQDNKEDRNQSLLTPFCADGARNTLEGPVRFWCQAMGCRQPKLVCSRAPALAPPLSRPVPCPAPLKSLSYLHPTSWLPPPLLIHSRLLLSAFFLCLLASCLAKTELCLSPEAPSQAARERHVGSFGHCHPCWVLGSQATGCLCVRYTP